MLSQLQLRVIDSVIFEQYQRTNVAPARGFAIAFDKAIFTYNVLPALQRMGFL